MPTFILPAAEAMKELTDETIIEIGEADVRGDKEFYFDEKDNQIKCREANTTCVKCGEETGWGFQYCSSCRF